MLFRSKFHRLEAFAAATPDQRNTENLAAAQGELDAAKAGLILVPKSETITSLAELMAHIQELQQAAQNAKAEAALATESLETLKKERVLTPQKVASDKGEGGDNMGEPSPEQRALSTIHNPNAPWNATADAMGFRVTLP
jgi:hypothetical protein